MRNESCDAIDNDERLDPVLHKPANQMRLRMSLQLAVAHLGTIPEDYPATIPCSLNAPGPVCYDKHATSADIQDLAPTLYVHKRGSD